VKERANGRNIDKRKERTKQRLSDEVEVSKGMGEGKIIKDLEEVD